MNEIRQWPAANHKQGQNAWDLLGRLNPNQGNHNQLKVEIETHFQNLFHNPVILFPSARAGLSNLLRSIGFDRGKTIFITKYSSHCLFTSLGSFTNISTDFINPDAILVNHKWGFLNSETRAQNSGTITIEDSCDSIIMNDADLFPNNEIATVISLPKVIGSISGALLILNSRSTDVLASEEWLRDSTFANEELGYWQTREKIKDLLGRDKQDFSTWLFYESINTYSTEVDLLDILDKLAYWETNANVIQERQASLQNFKGVLIPDDGRLGPVVLLNNSANFSLSNQDFDQFIMRKFDVTRKNDHLQKYTDMLVFPIHADIGDERFFEQQKLIEKLANASN